MINERSLYYSLFFDLFFSLSRIKWQAARATGKLIPDKSISHAVSIESKRNTICCSTASAKTWSIFSSCSSFSALSRLATKDVSVIISGETPEEDPELNSPLSLPQSSFQILNAWKSGASDQWINYKNGIILKSRDKRLTNSDCPLFANADTRALYATISPWIPSACILTNSCNACAYSPCTMCERNVSIPQYPIN